MDTATNIELSHGIVLNKKHGTLVIPRKLEVANLIPAARQLEHYNISSMTDDAWKLLNNCGIQAPHPIEYKFHWGFRAPYRHQIETVLHIIKNRRCFVLSQMGTGKTAACVWAYDYMVQHNLVKKAAVLAPLSTLRATWENEFSEVAPVYDVSVCHHREKARRLKIMERPADVYLFNTDAINIKEVHEWLLANTPDILFVDECVAFKRCTTERWKALYSLVKSRPSMRLVMMSGLPTPKDLTDSHGQIRLVNDTAVPRSYKKFREQLQIQVSPFTWRDKPDAASRVHKLMQPAVRHLTRDCIDLPPTSFTSREVELTAAQKAAYKELNKEMALTLKDGTQITAVNTAALIAKLVQICTGFLYVKNTDKAHAPMLKSEVSILGADNRINECRIIFDESAGKMLIFAPFKAAVTYIADSLTSTYGTGKVAIITGAVGEKDRAAIFKDFQSKGGDIDIIVAVPSCMSHGVTLTEADTIVWFAPTHNYETFDQANARIVRPGQKRHTNIVSLYGTAVERRIMTALRNKESISTTFLNFYREDTV